MPLYTFRLPAAFSSTPVTVYNTADVQQTTGTTDANAVFTATLPTGDYYAKVSYGYRSYRAAGEVDRGDLDNVSEAALSATFAGLPGLLSRRPAERPTNFDPNDILTAPMQLGLALTSADGFNELIHPSVVHAPEKWNGYRYWMAATPYHNSDSTLENPHLYVSQDGDTWTAPPGVTNPLEAYSGAGLYNSDTHLTFGPDGRLYMFFRKSGAAIDTLYYRASADGVDWTDKQTVLVGTASNTILSPAIQYLNGKWLMWTVDITGSPNAVTHRTASSPTGPWSAPTTCTGLTPPGRDPWHLDVQVWGGSFVMILDDTDLNTSGVNGNLWVATSADGIAWTLADAKLLASYNGYNFYRSCSVPSQRGGELGLDLFYSRNTNPMGTFRAWAPLRPVESRALDNMPLLLAKNLVSPWVAGDSFNRADSAVSPGNLDSGQAWTVQAGTAGISSNKLYAAVAGNTKVAASLGLADGYVEVKVSTQDGNTWLMFRNSDGSNYWRFGSGATGGVLTLQKVVAGAVTEVQYGSFPLLSGDRIGARFYGNKIDVFRNGFKVGTYTDAFNNTAQLAGVQMTTTASRFDDFVARSLLAGGR